MGNSAPKESYMGNSLRCCKCYKVLPPCNNWNDLCRRIVNERDVYVFNGGEYYRPYDVFLHECAHCFHQQFREIEMRREQERRRQEEQKREEQRREEQRREEQRREEETIKKREQLNQRLQESQQQAEELLEKELSSKMSEECESRRKVLKSHLDEFENMNDSNRGRDELLEILSLKCNMEVSDLSVTKLTTDQLGNILSALDNILFDEWISAPPSLSTLQHAQVYITELCGLSMEISEDVSLEIICNRVQSLVVSISQSAQNASENFMLTQALFLTLMHFLTDTENSDTDAVLIAKQWSEEELSSEHLFATEFLSILTSSLNDAVRTTSLLISYMEIQCLKLLLYTLEHVNDKETHSESTKMILSLVKTNQWNPVEALTLLNFLSQKCAQGGSVTEILTLVQVYDISPDWTDISGGSLIQAFELIDSERLTQDFLKILREKDERSLDAAVEEIKLSHDLDDAEIDKIKNIITGIFKYSETVPKEEDLQKDYLKSGSFDENDLQKCLSQLCKAVFQTKGWWPTVKHMLDCCVFIWKMKTGVPQLVDGNEDSCAIAMFSAIQVCMGKKVGVVLSSDCQSEEKIEGWSDFFRNLGVSLKNNNKNTNAIEDVYEADIVYGTLDNFVSDYIQHGIKTMETGILPHQCDLFSDTRSLNSSNLELSSLKNSNSLVFVAEVQQKLLYHIQSQEIEQRQHLVNAVFQVLNTNLIKDKNTESKIVKILKELTGKELSSSEIFILTFLENLLRVFTSNTEDMKHMASTNRWCLETLFTCARQIDCSDKERKDVFWMVSNLGAQTLWSPEETFTLIEALTDHHQDEGCISIMRILHLMITFQVSSKWRDESKRSLLELLGSWKTKNLIQHLEKSFRDEKSKDIDSIFYEIRQMKDIDEETLNKAYSVITHVSNLIKTGEIEKYKDVQELKNISTSLETGDLQKLLAVLCNAVHLFVARGKWWPRTTQMISWCLLALSDTGKLLEMGTGEGKSCVIAMFAAWRVLRGEKVDVVSTSSVLCQRDAEEWREFYKCFGITVDTNTNKTDDKGRKECYQKDVIYGTVETFAADHLRQTFEMKDVRPERGYQCIIIDEVDSLLLDQGVQSTYLASPMVSMQHLNPILAMIWAHVSQYGFLSSGDRTFVQCPPTSFFKAIFDSMNTEEIKIDDPMDILSIAEETDTVPKGFTKEIYNSKKDEILMKLKTVNKDDVVDFFGRLEDYVPYGFTVYTLNDEEFLCLRKISPYKNHNIPELKFLVLDDGLCCALYDSEEMIINSITELISEQIQYTPCTPKDKISIPGFLKDLIEKKMSVWVQNAFLAIQLKEGRDYVVENNNICPVDFRSTGIVELNKKWSDGLQQFVEIKHQTKLSTLSTVTNYISNISFFEKYQGKIYGTTGTLGSKQDLLLLKDLYPNLSACKIPTFNRKMLFEVKGTVKNSSKEWKSEIKRVVMDEISTNSYRDGRSALVICETINKAEEIYEELKGSISGKINLYCRSDNDSLSKIVKEQLPGDVIVATNLAGRGTDIKVSKQVNNNGGLFVILSFISENTRVELQAFGRTARKGKPGSAQIIMSTENMQQDFRMVTSLDEAKRIRDQLAEETIKNMKNDLTEMNLREELFSEYCKFLQDIYRDTNGDERNATVAIMNEFWGIWLLIKSEEIDQLKRDQLKESLKLDLAKAKSQCKGQTSPCSSIYHFIKFGNIALDAKQWDLGAKLFSRAMEKDANWAAIAFYNHAFCTIKQQKGDYLTIAREDLTKAKASLNYFREEACCLKFVKMASSGSAKSETTGLEKQLTARCNMYNSFDKNITEAIQKLDEIKDRDRDAIAKKSPVFFLVPQHNEELKEEAFALYDRGLKYVFSVEEKPRFSWEGLLVFCLGLLQIIGGALLTAFTFGAAAQFGIGLITEGVSDCIYGIEAMVTGEFSWKDWAIDKAISIGVSILTFGVGKLVSKGFKACKMLMKGLGKELKALPEFLPRQAKEGLSDVMTKNMKTAANHATKKVVEEALMYGFGKAEQEILEKILQSIKRVVEKGIADDVKSKMKEDPLNNLVDSIILSHIEDVEQLHDLLEDKDKRRDLLVTFKHLSSTALQPIYQDLSWQKKINSALMQITDGVKAEAKGKVKLFLTAIKTTHYMILAEDAIGAVHDLSSRFFSTFQDQLNTFNQKTSFQGKVTINELTDKEIGMLKAFKQDLANTICASVADALVEVFHRKFTSHIVSQCQDKLNGHLRNHARSGLNTDRTYEKLKAGQNNRYIAHMPVNQSSALVAGNRSRSHAETIKNPKTKGTILDVRVLSEATGTKVVILTEDKHGRLNKMQEVSPSTKPSTQTVTLIYRPKSSQNPDGHYDVCINNKTVQIDSKENSCLFHAIARGIKPKASEKDIILEANRLRVVESDALLRDPGQWEPFIRCKEQIEKMRGGDWYLAKGATRLTKKQKGTFKQTVGKAGIYKTMRKQNQFGKMGKFINADHQPPVSSILDARKLNQNSKLATAMLEVATKSSPLDQNAIPDVKKKHGLELPTVNIPTEIHRECPSTKSPKYRDLVAKTISSDDVVGTFKLTILGSIPRFKLDPNKGFMDFKNNSDLQYKLDEYEKSFPEHSKKMSDCWFNHLQHKNVMSQEDYKTIKEWINNEGYNNHDDPYRKQVITSINNKHQKPEDTSNKQEE